MSRNAQKSKTPTSSKSNRFSKLLKKKKKSKKSKSSKSHYHLEVDDELPPMICHRKSSPFITTTNAVNDIDSYRGSSTSERKETHHSMRDKRSLSLHQYNIQHSKIDTLNMNTNKRNVPPPPPKHKKSNTTIHSNSNSVGHRTTYQQHHNDGNISINIDINKNHNLTKKHSNTRRPRHKSLHTIKDDTDSLSPTSSQSPQSPQSPAARFIAHIPRQSIEHKLDIKQLLYEMIDMKRQIKSLKKDVKFLKTENNLCHQRITFLEQTFENQQQQNQSAEYSHFVYNNKQMMPPATTLHPQPPETPICVMDEMNLCPSHSQIQNIQIQKQTQTQLNIEEGINRSSSFTSTESVELDLNGNDVDMETKLRKLSHKLATANVFSEEYRRLEYELERLIQQNDDTKNNINYYHNTEDNNNNIKQCQFNDGTMIIHKKQNNEKRLCRINNNPDDSKDGEKESESENDNQLECGSITQVKSLCTLSRRSTNTLFRKKKYKKKYSNHVKDAKKYSNHDNDDGKDEGMQILD